MQPYIFPYIGYFQLINVVDKFVIYNDVNFIRQGWINRNRVLSGGKELLYTVPLENASSFKKINEVAIHQKLYNTWKIKFFRTLHASYSRAPFFTPTLSLVKDTLDKELVTIDLLATESIKNTCNYLGITTPIVLSSEPGTGKELRGKDRVISICHKESASTYINVVGGQDLYSKDHFRENGLALSFIQPKPIIYPQFSNEFVPWLSVIDIMMFNSPGDIQQMLTEYTLI